MSVRSTVKGPNVRVLTRGYNGSVPGPTIRVKPGDTFVDFACGQNSFGPLLIDPLTGKAIASRAYDILSPAENTADFYRQPWASVEPTHLPEGELIIGLNPPFGSFNEGRATWNSRLRCDTDDVFRRTEPCGFSWETARNGDGDEDEEFDVGGGDDVDRADTSYASSGVGDESVSSVDTTLSSSDEMCDGELPYRRQHTYMSHPSSAVSDLTLHH